MDLTRKQCTSLVTETIDRLNLAGMHTIVLTKDDYNAEDGNYVITGFDSQNHILGEDTKKLLKDNLIDADFDNLTSSTVFDLSV